MSLADLGFSLNAFLSQSLARQPRGTVTVNGVNVAWESFEVDNNTYYLADTFRVVIPTQGIAVPLSTLSSVSTILVEIQAGFPPIINFFSSFSLDQLIVGQVDDVHYEPSKGRITLSGRDLTARFIDNKTTEKFQNLTSSQIATQLAQRRGLTPVVTPTTIKVGRYYEIDHARLTDQKSEWDLLTYLAREENYSVFVKGQSLYFQPKAAATQTPYVINFTAPFLASGYPTSNVVDLELSRNLTLAKDVIVRVHSWNLKQKKGFTVKAQATHNKNTVLRGAAQPTGDAQVFEYTYPNLSPEQALQKAQNLLKEISQHEVRARIRMPADNLVQAEGLLQVLGTNTNFDQTYYVSSVLRSLSFDQGYTMQIEAKNHSPDTETSA